MAACLPGRRADRGHRRRTIQRQGRRSAWGRSSCSSPAPPRSPSATHAARRIVVDAAGADEKGRGQASLRPDRPARSPTASGTKVEVEQDLHLSGAAAQYGRGMIADVTRRADAATSPPTCRRRIDAIDRGASPTRSRTTSPPAASASASRAAWMALKRVVRRFFLPYQPNPS